MDQQKRNGARFKVGWGSKALVCTLGSGMPKAGRLEVPEIYAMEATAIETMKGLLPNASRYFHGIYFPQCSTALMQHHSYSTNMSMRL